MPDDTRRAFSMQQATRNSGEGDLVHFRTTCGKIAQVATLLESGAELAGFRIESLLGQGGMGTIYLATQLKNNRQVALKVLSAERRDDPEFEERFIRESQIAASLNHPNILPVFDTGDADGLMYLALPYVEGGDLRELLKERGRLPALLALSVARQIALALQAAHSADLVHRDVKPANILLGLDDHAYLADFGLARRASVGGLTRSGVFMGTPDYAAPEQLERIRTADGRADIYSLGCVLYHCLAGQPPFVRESETGVISAHLNDPAPLLSQVRPDLPIALNELLRNAMAKDRRERYQHAADFATAIGAAIADLNGIPQQPPPPQPTRRTVGDKKPPAERLHSPSATPTVLDRVVTPGPASDPIVGPTRQRPHRRVIVWAVAAIAVIGAIVAGAVGVFGGSPSAKSPSPAIAAPSTAPPARVTGVRAFATSRKGKGLDRKIRVVFRTAPTKQRPVSYTRYRTTPPGTMGERRSNASGPIFIGGLTNGTAYRVEVRACNSHDECGPWSKPSGVVEPFGEPPPPRLVSVKPHANTVHVDWSLPKSSNGRSIDRVALRYRTGGAWHTVHYRPAEAPVALPIGYLTHVCVKLVSLDSARQRSKPSRQRCTRTVRRAATPAPPSPTPTPTPKPPPLKPVHGSG